MTGVVSSSEPVSAMLDNRYFRTGEKRGLGNGQTEWLKEQLLDCKGEFIIITCGTMWTDHISKGKDSWGKFDPEGRKNSFSLSKRTVYPGCFCCQVTATEPADFVFPVLPVIPFMNLRQLLSADEVDQQAGQFGCSCTILCFRRAEC